MLTDPKRRPKLHTTCPYCQALQKYDKLHTRFYKCGTKANRDSGRYLRGCK